MFSTPRLLSVVACLSLVACSDSDETESPATDATTDTIDAGADGNIDTDGSAEPDVVDTDTDTSLPDVQPDVEPDTEPDTADTVQGDTETDIDDDTVEGDVADATETDGSSADTTDVVDAGPTTIAGRVTLAGFGIVGVTITATPSGGGDSLTTSTSAEDGSFSIEVPAGEWTVTASLADHEFSVADALELGDRDGEIEQNFRLLTTTAAFEADEFGSSSPLEPATLPVLNGALQYRTIAADGDGVWFRVDTDETGPLAIFTANLGVTTDTRIQVFDAVAYLDDDNRDDLVGTWGTEREDDDSALESTLVLPYEESGVTDYLVFVGNYDDPCGYGTFFLGAASGDAILDADEDGFIALRDCASADGNIYPGADEPWESTSDLNCDGLIASDLPAPEEATNTTLETAIALAASNRDSIEPGIDAARTDERDVYNFDSTTELWFTIDWPEDQFYYVEQLQVAGSCEIEAEFFDGDTGFEIGGFFLQFPLTNNLERDVNLVGRFFVSEDSELAEGVRCAMQFVVSDLGFDRDDDLRPTNGFGGDRDLDDTDEAVGSCENSLGESGE